MTVRLLRQIGLFLAYGAIGALLSAVTLGVMYLQSREDLEIWHRVALPDYRDGGDVQTFADYLNLEARLRDALERRVIDEVPAGTGTDINRYARASLSSPANWAHDWNFSYEWPAVDAPAGVLLLHGMSDSPYSLRTLAELLHRKGFHVLGLRYPGHGTTPGSLTETRWEDMYGAVRLAARHLAGELGGRSLFVVGYSTGAPLAVELSLEAMENDTVPMPAGLVFFSPAMGITPLAAVAPWQARLGRLLGLDKMEWNTIEPEYDPFKYRSFPVNAAVQVWRLSNRVAGELASHEADGTLGRLPPILSFQSVVDETIEARALLDVLYRRLPARDVSPDRSHQLVVYDLNRKAAMEPLLVRNPSPLLESVIANAQRSYEFSVISNRDSVDGMVRVRTGARGDKFGSVCRLDVVWPQGVYSLSHIALPFPPTDALYGGPEAEAHAGIQLGNVVLRGEPSALKVSPGGLLRQSYNPFFDYQVDRIARFMGFPAPAACFAVPDGRAG